MRRLFRSLQAKYMLIIFFAIFLVLLIQVIYATIATFILKIDKNDGRTNPYDYNLIEQQWHQEAKQLQNISKKHIYQHFIQWKRRYPKASMFWVDGNGVLAEQLNLKEKLPSQWTPTDTAKFIKGHYAKDPFTVVSFVGKEDKNGFIVIEIPRLNFEPPLQKIYDRYGTILFISMVFIIFLFVTLSFLFFRGIRKRLLQLQEAMEIRDVDGLPLKIDVKQKDEIGQLEKAFNQMVNELKSSRTREQKEEQLRRELIAKLSHDLRTPLTKISSQIYYLEKEDSNQNSRQAIKALENSVQDIDRLIENLMSYTLLMASKYKLEPKEIDIIRFVRECLATWYPVFEKEGFVFEVELDSFEDRLWSVDSTWMGRIIDNLLQNVLRHAHSGRYLNVKTETTDEYDALIFMDRGKGMNHQSNQKGAGIGLSIVDMMTKGIGLEWDIDSSEQGTAIRIKRSKLRV